MARSRRSRWKWRSDSSPFVGLVMGLARFARPVLSRAGVDVVPFEEVLRAKLSLELRRAPEAGRNPVGDLALTLFILGFFVLGGLAGVFALIAEPELALWVGGSQGVLLLALGMFLLMYYVPLLVDPLDIDVLAPYPVSDRTLFLSRIAHVGMYLGAMATAFVMPQLILAPIAFRSVTPVLLAPLFTAATLATALGGVGLAVAILLRVLGPRRFQRATLWMQVVFATFAFGGSQVLPRLGSTLEMQIDWTRYEALLWLLPPTHQAQAVRLLHGSVGPGTLIGAGLGLLGPLVLLWVAAALASRHFAAGISGELQLTRPKPRGWSVGPTLRMSRALVKGREERAGMEYTLPLSRREAPFLRGGLPQLVGTQVMAVVMMLNLAELGDIDASASRWGLRVGIPMFFGFVLLSLPGIIGLAQQGKNGEARWIFEVAPIEQPGAVLSGGLKGLMLGLIVPIALLEVLIVSIAFGPGQLGPALLAFILTGILVLVSMRKLRLSLLFTAPRSSARNELQNCGVIFTQLIAQAVAIVLHVALAWYPAVMWVAIAVLVPVLVKCWGELRDNEPATGVLSD